MQTFLPSTNLPLGISQLDTKRLLKQRVEAIQIIRTLAGITQGWKHHPAVKMWKGHESFLLYTYTWEVQLTCENQEHYSVWVDEQYYELTKLISPLGHTISPSWLIEEFCAAHRSNLLRKDPVFYSQWGWTEPPNLPYLWPVR